MAIRKNGTASYPKSSNAMSIEVIGQFVTPQNTAIMPTAAQSDGEIPTIPPNRQPKVAHIKNDGTISPPLKPASRVNAVKIIFHINAIGFTFPPIALTITGTPAPI